MEFRRTLFYVYIYENEVMLMKNKDEINKELKEIDKSSKKDDYKSDIQLKLGLWPIMTIVLIILLVVSIFTSGFWVMGSKSGNAISLQDASAKAVSYVNNMLQGKGSARVSDIQDTGSLYRLKMDIAGQNYDSYMTRDGKLLFPTSLDLTIPIQPVDNIQPNTQPTNNVDVSVDDDPSIGPADAPITIIEFSDFQCPFCNRVQPTIKQILTTYGNKVRLVYRDFPLSFHQNAQKAAEASECVHEQDTANNDANYTLFWKYHDILFQNQDSLDTDNLKQYAIDIGLDSTTFNACLDSGKYRSEVQKDTADGSNAGVSGTPAFFVNGQLVSGAQPFSAFKTIIDAELAKA